MNEKQTVCRAGRLTVRILVLLLSVLMMLTAVSCSRKSGGSGTGGGVNKPGRPAESGPPPAGTLHYEVGNLSLWLPAGFKPFTSGQKANAGAFTDGNAYYYVRKCLPADTGTSETYFARLTASEYGDLLLYGTEDYEEYAGHNTRSAGFFFTHEGETAETTKVFCQYYVKDKANACFWLVECQCTAEYSEQYVSLFSELDQYFVLIK